jgi:hypothetical protein
MVAGPDSGDEDVIEVQFVSMTVEDNSPTSFDYFSSPNSPNNFWEGFVSGLKQGRPLAYMRGDVREALSGPCSRGQREELVPAHPTWDVLLRRTRCPSGRRVGVRG